MRAYSSRVTPCSAAISGVILISTLADAIIGFLVLRSAIPRVRHSFQHPCILFKGKVKIRCVDEPCARLPIELQLPRNPPLLTGAGNIDFFLRSGAERFSKADS